ncbi:MAG TPA: hypothetical protein VF950_17480 [Planctomycetota bacterium]
MAGNIIGGICMTLGGAFMAGIITYWAKKVADTYGPEAWKSAKVIAFLVLFWLGGLGMVGGGIYFFAKAAGA